MVQLVPFVQATVVHPCVVHRAARPKAHVVTGEAQREGTSRTVGCGTVGSVQAAGMEDDRVPRLCVEDEDAAFADIGLLVVRFSQRLPGPFTAEAQQALAHRHADLLIAGLRADPSAPPLSGPALNLADLRHLLPRV